MLSYRNTLCSAATAFRNLFAFFWSLLGFCAKATVTKLFVHFVPAKNVQLEENMTGGAEYGLVEDWNSNLAIEGFMTWILDLVIPRI